MTDRKGVQMSLQIRKRMCRVWYSARYWSKIDCRKTGEIPISYHQGSTHWVRRCAVDVDELHDRGQGVQDLQQGEEVAVRAPGRVAQAVGAVGRGCGHLFGRASACWGANVAGESYTASRFFLHKFTSIIVNYPYLDKERIKYGTPYSYSSLNWAKT